MSDGAEPAVDLAMTSMLTTWQALAGESVLVLINSPEGEIAEVAALFDRLAPRLERSEVYVVTPPEWTSWLHDRGLPADHVLPSADAQDRPLELNYFLESPVAGIWIRSKPVDYIVGSVPHSLYNEEVKDLLEERLSLFVGSSRFLAHTLPQDYVYVFDLPMMLRRSGRADKVKEYRATCRSMVDAWHRQWIDAGRPARDDGPDIRQAASVIGDHLGAGLLSPDESSPISIERLDPVASIVGTIRYLQDLLGRTQALQGEVDRRDVLIAEAHVRYDRTLDARLRRLARKLGLHSRH